jgi:hypothetical protein
VTQYYHVGCFHQGWNIFYLVVARSMLQLWSI